MPRKAKPAIPAPVSIRPDQITVSIATAAAVLNVSKPTIMRLIKSGKLRASKITRKVYIDVADIRAMLTANVVSASPGSHATTGSGMVTA